MGRIILAEDDEIVADLVTTAFLRAGHGIGWLPDGRSALAVIRQRPPDLAILDCNMPVMSGTILLRTIRSTAALCGIPVLMLTARRSLTDEDIARFEGAMDYVRKPFDPIMLVRRAETLMSGARRWT